MSLSPRQVFNKIGSASLLLLAGQIILYCSTRVVSTTLSKQDYGTFGLAMSCGANASQFVLWGLDPLLTVHFARASADESRRLFGTVLRLKQCAALLGMLLAFLAVTCFANENQRATILLGCIGGLTFGFSMSCLFDSRGLNSVYQFCASVRHAAYLSGVILLANIFPTLFQPHIVVAVHASCIGLEVLLEQIWARRNYGKPEWPIYLSTTYPLWFDAAPMALAMLSQQALIVIGPIAMQVFGDNSEAGALYLSNQLATAAASFIAVPTALAQATLAKEADVRRLRRSVLRMSLLFGLAGIFYAGALSFISQWLVPLMFTQVNAPAAPILAVDAWRLAPMLAAAPVSAALICRNRLKAFASAHVFALVLGTVICAIFIRSYGAQAAAAAVGVGRFGFLVLCALFFIFDKGDLNTEASA